MANYEITEVRLLNVPLENDYTHTLYFENSTAQASYFMSKTVDTMANSSYQRKDKKIRWDSDYDDVIGANYVMYKNGDKWYYAFITNIDYVSPGMCDIYIETDVIQTWLFNYTVNTSFIEREHTNDDRIGHNTIPEGLETGEYIKNGDGKIDGALMETCIILAVTEDADGNKTVGKKYGGVFSGVGYRYALTTDNAKAFIEAYDGGKADAIQAIFLAPTQLVSIDPNNDGGFIKETATANFWDINLGSAPTTLDGYTPRNKKLLCYPYSYLYVTNQQGGCGIYHNEKFYNGGDRKFRTYGVITPGCSIRTMPMQYDVVAYNSDYSIPLGKFPVCNWTSDVYTNWLTQNSINNVMTGVTAFSSIAGGVAMLGTGAGTLAGVGMIAGGVTAIMNSVSQHQQHDLIPAQASGNLNCGDVAFSSGHNNFRYLDMSIKAEYARVIDDYFSMFGYKTNRVKTPNKNHRANYWYTKTIDCNITGAIPMEDMRKIKDCYNRGITFWKNPANIKNYNVDNSIV